MRATIDWAWLLNAASLPWYYFICAPRVVRNCCFALFVSLSLSLFSCLLDKITTFYGFHCRRTYSLITRTSWPCLTTTITITTDENALMKTMFRSLNIPFSFVVFLDQCLQMKSSKLFFLIFPLSAGIFVAMRLLC